MFPRQVSSIQSIGERPCKKIMYGHVVSPRVGFASLILRLYAKSHVIGLRNRFCILRDPGGNVLWLLFQEGRCSIFKLRRGVEQAAYNRNNPHVKCTRVYCA